MWLNVERMKKDESDIKNLFEFSVVSGARPAYCFSLLTILQQLG